MNLETLIKIGCDVVEKEGEKLIKKAIKNTPAMAKKMKESAIVHVAIGAVVAAGGALLDAAIQVSKEEV